MWIVMTSSAKMPSKCWGQYRNVALVQLTQHFTAWGLKPAMISPAARGVHRVVHMGRHNVGKTAKCAYERVKAEAEERARVLNSSHPAATDDLLVTWGGSA